MMLVCQEARLALVPDWLCPYCPTVVMVAWEETESTRRRDDGRRQYAGAWALGRRPADGKFETPALHATHMIWPEGCGWREGSETGREYSDLPFKRVH